MAGMVPPHGVQPGDFLVVVRMSFPFAVANRLFPPPPLFGPNPVADDHP